MPRCLANIPCPICNMMTTKDIISKYGMHMDEADIEVSNETCDLGASCNCWGRLY